MGPYTNDPTYHQCTNEKFLWLFDKRWGPVELVVDRDVSYPTKIIEKVWNEYWKHVGKAMLHDTVW